MSVLRCGLVVDAVVGVLSVELDIDVTAPVNLGGPASIAVTVTLPEADDLPGLPVVCFAKPGNGYAKGYFTVDLPGPAHGIGSQAEWHASRGWIFVALDTLGAGASSTHHDPLRLDFTTVTAASSAAEREVLARLASGTLVDGYPAVSAPLTIGIGHSMGGLITVIQQGRYHGYDGVAALGFSSIHVTAPMPAGVAPFLMPWIPRDAQLTDDIVVNAPAIASATFDDVVKKRAGSGAALGWSFYYDDVDPEIVAADLDDFPARNGNPPVWVSTTMPMTTAVWCTAPGAAAPEAAAITVPVLVGIGERDTIADPKGEPRAYLSATSVDMFICPRMGHIHNVAGTRELLWERIHSWGEWCKQSQRSHTPVQDRRVST